MHENQFFDSKTKYFPYSKTNGILRYIMNVSTDRYPYPMDFAIIDSNKFYNYRPHHAFDFDNQSFWRADRNNTALPFLTICLAYESVKFESFEITTSDSDCRPGVFNVSLSMDGLSYYGNQQFEANMAKNEVKVFQFNSDYTRCFRYIPISSIDSCDDLLHDIVQLEFYGYMKNKTIIECTNYEEAIFAYARIPAVFSMQIVCNLKL